MLVAGGAGNPGGRGWTYGENGTGGTLIIFSEEIINNGRINSEGSLGGAAARAGGGSSGGGTINIFYRNSFASKGNIFAKGGKQVLGGWGIAGGAGGDGTVTLGNI